MSQGEGAPGRPAGDGGRILVEDAGGARPFMRGILIHSLMARGATFEGAFAVANRVRERLRGRRVSREELAAVVTETCRGDGLVLEPGSARAVPEISVVSHGQETPFSKGILSQSLLAAALEPAEAWDVARRIQDRLLREGHTRIERKQLRRLVHEVLERTEGPRAAHRYLVWRQYQDPDRPVIILLGGTAGVGKTSLALEVAHRLGIGRVMSTDAIRQVMRIMLSRELVPAIHSSSYDAWRDPLFEPTPGADPVVEAFAAQASVVSVGVKAMLERAIAENTSLILDGVSLLPGRLDLGAYSDRAHLRFLVVATLDREAFRSRFARRAAFQKGRPPHRYLEHLDQILRIQEYILELAEAHDVPIVENTSFDRSVLSILRHVTETLGAEEAPDVGRLL